MSTAGTAVESASPRPHARADRSALIVAHTFAPSSLIGTMRTLRLVRRLHAQGWRVTVLTASPSTYTADTPVDPDLLQRVPPGVRLLQVPVVRGLTRLTAAFRQRPSVTVAAPSSQGPVTARPKSRSLVRQAYDVVDELTSIPDKEAGWIVPALAKGLWHLSRVGTDVIYSSAPPWTGQVVALGLARATGLPWVADFRDPWARAPWRETQPARIRRASAWLEPRVVARANAMLFATRNNREEYVRHYGDPLAAKSYVVTNGCDPEEFAHLPRSAASGRFVLMHAGTLYGARNPVALFRAIANAIRGGRIDRDAFRLRLIGQASSAMDDLPSAAASLGLADVVEFVPRLRRAEILREMAAASCLLALQPGTTVSVPGKLYEYLAIGRPILAIAEEGETADLVRASGLGKAVLPHDEAAIEDALVELMKESTREVSRPSPHLYDGNMAADYAITLIEQLIAAKQLA
jgi:glycosyltransferase involved in cell wall biosynthesis